MSMATEDPTGIPIPSNKTYLSERQVQDYKAEIDGLERTLADPRARLENRGKVIQQLRAITRDLELQSPPDVTPDQKDRIAREERELREKIVSEMCSKEEMRKCPPGAIGKYRKGENSPAVKAMILRWKNMMRILHKGDDDPDVSNLEKHRPTASTLNMQNAMISGKDYFIPPNTQAYRDGYDRTFGTGEASSEQVEALLKKVTELEQRLESAPSTRKKKAVKKREYTPEELEQMPYLAVAPCGRQFRGRSQHRVDFGLTGHKRGCDECKAREGDTA